MKSLIASIIFLVTAFTGHTSTLLTNWIHYTYSEIARDTCPPWCKDKVTNDLYYLGSTAPVLRRLNNAAWVNADSTIPDSVLRRVLKSAENGKIYHEQLNIAIDIIGELNQKIIDRDSLIDMYAVAYRAQQNVLRIQNDRVENFQNMVRLYDQIDNKNLAEIKRQKRKGVFIGIAGIILSFATFYIGSHN
jgi:hypothetical protein